MPLVSTLIIASLASGLIEVWQARKIKFISHQEEKIIKLTLRNSITGSKTIVDCYSREHAKSIIKNQIEFEKNNWRIIVTDDEIESIINELKEDFNRLLDSCYDTDDDTVAVKISLADFVTYMDFNDIVKIWDNGIVVYNGVLKGLFFNKNYLSKKLYDYHISSFATAYNEIEDVSYLNIDITK